MNLLLTHDGDIRTELSILYAKLQIYYLMQIYLWRKHDIERAKIFKARLKQLQDSEIEDKQQDVSTRTLCTVYMRMRESYVHELAMVDRVLEEHPALFLMENEQIMEILEKETEDYASKGECDI